MAMKRNYGKFYNSLFNLVSLVEFGFNASKLLKVCERSLSGSGGGRNTASATQFVREETLPSGYLIRPCNSGGSINHIVDHLNLEVTRTDHLNPNLFLGNLLINSIFYSVGVEYV